MSAAFEASNAFAATDVFTAVFAMRSTEATASMVRFSEKVVSVIVSVSSSVTGIRLVAVVAVVAVVVVAEVEKPVAAETPLPRVSVAEIAASRRAAQPLTVVPDPLAHEASSLMVVMVASLREVSRVASGELG
jgi:hypothetical protein